MIVSSIQQRMSKYHCSSQARTVSIFNFHHSKMLLLIASLMLQLLVLHTITVSCFTTSNINSKYGSSSSSSCSIKRNQRVFDGRIRYPHFRRETIMFPSSISANDLASNDNHNNDIIDSKNTIQQLSTTTDGRIVSNTDSAGYGTGTATIPSHVFNLVKGIVGAGVLSIPSGIATYGNSPSALIPAVLLIVLIGIMSGYGFSLIGRVCSITQSTSYRDAWKYSLNESSSIIPAISVTCKTLSAIIAYSMILGDTCCSILQGFGFVSMTKQLSLLLLTVTTLLPLCLLKNLKSLAPFSLIGTLGMIYTTIAMGIRYYTKVYTSNGYFINDIPKIVQPFFGTAGASAVFTPNTSILLGMLSTAYMAHFNAPKFFIELQNNTIQRYNTVVSISFGISILLFTLVGIFGFLTFGGNCCGLILNNYSTRDQLMSIARIAVAVSIIFSYPLAFTGAREGIIDLLKMKKQSSSKTTVPTVTSPPVSTPTTLSPTVINAISISLLSAVTVLALSLPDVSFVLAFTGATLGNCLIYVFPGLMFRGAIQKKIRQGTATKSQQKEVKLAMAQALVGAGLGILGAVKAVQNFL